MLTVAHIVLLHVLRAICMKQNIKEKTIAMENANGYKIFLELMVTVRLPVENIANDFEMPIRMARI